MRQLFFYTAFCSLLFASMPGCQSIGGVQTASRDKQSASQKHAALAEQPATTRHAPIRRDPVRPVGYDEQQAPVSPVSIVGILVRDEIPEQGTAEPVRRIAELDPQVAGIETFPAIDIIAQTQAVTETQAVAGQSQEQWGHTTVSAMQLVPEPAGVEFPADLQSPTPEYAETTFEHSGHTIRVGDELEIKFPHKPLFSEKVMVREDGMIAVPLIDPVRAAGMTPESLQELLARRYHALQYDPSSVRGQVANKKYLISVKDKLDVRFDSEDANNSELNKLSDSVTVRPDGKISLPLVGTLQAEGKTPEELEAEIVSGYREFYREAKPVLIVREFTNNQVLVDGRMQRTGMKDIDDVVVLTRTFERMVYVAGEVQKPGFVRFKGPMTVSQAIIAAGGPKRTAEMRNVARFREGAGCQAVGELLDLKTQWTYEKQKRKAYCERPAVDDVLLGANDVVIVPKTRIAKLNDCLDQYVYQLVPMTRNTQFQYLYTTGATVGAFGF